MPEYPISVVVNGVRQERSVSATLLLRDFVRDDLGLTGTKEACEDGMCGACSLHLDGRVVKSCLVLAVEADGHDVVTIEGLAGQAPGSLHRVQQALLDHFGFQCGFCTPGFVMTMAALCAERPPRDAGEAQRALVGNICRCTGYTAIVDAFLAAAGHSDDGSTTGERDDG